MGRRAVGSDHRKVEYRVDPMFPDRWSSRAMSGEEITEEELNVLFEAARWAPSCFNSQPWRFLYARRNTEHWETFFHLMGDYNQSWAKNAAALIVALSRKTFEHNGEPAPTHSYDTGAAWMSLALQAALRGLVVRGMAGFDYDRARTELNVPEDYRVEAMAAVGKPGRRDDLPEKLREKEVPNDRKKVSEFAREGKFRS